MMTHHQGSQTVNRKRPRGPFAECVDPQSGMSASGGSCEAQAAFLAFDRDSSGVIDTREFRRVLEAVEEVSPAAAARAMARRDLDSNGEH